MLRPIIFLCLFSISLGGLVDIRQGNNIPFYVNSAKTLTCDARFFTSFPIRYQWLVSIGGSPFKAQCAGANPGCTFTFHELGSGKIICQAKGFMGDKYFTNSTPSNFNVLPEYLSGKTVAIQESSPIRFKLNKPKFVTCRASGFSPPVSYRWVNGSNKHIYYNSPVSTVQFTFLRRERGSLICEASGWNDVTYMSSDPKAYVAGQSRIGICYLTIATAIGLAMLLTYEKSFL